MLFYKKQPGQCLFLVHIPVFTCFSAELASFSLVFLCIFYAKNVINNAKVLSDTLKEEGFKIVSSGTDNHMFLLTKG